MPKGVYPRIKKADLDSIKETDSNRTLLELREHIMVLNQIRNEMSLPYTNNSPIAATATSKAIHSSLESQLKEAVLALEVEFNKLYGSKTIKVTSPSTAIDFNSDAKSSLT